VPGVYVTLNPVKPELLSRCYNRLQEWAKSTTNDNDIIKRCWFIVDIDYQRPSDISTTEDEFKLSHERAIEIRNFLNKKGWSEPIYANSGNGAHLLYRIDLPNNEDSRQLLKKCLDVLDFKFSGNNVNVDTGMYNASRIIKLYGTKACKGDDTSDRPHRLAKLINVPDKLDIVTKAQLNELSMLAPSEVKPKEIKNIKSKINVPQKINEWGLRVIREGIYNNNNYRWIIECPENPDHTDNSAFIIQYSNGAVAAGCLHNSCRWWKWQDLREKFEPGYQDILNNKPVENNHNTPNKEEKQTGKVVHLIELSEVEPEQVSWLWHPYIPRGKVTIIEGVEGEGKSWLSLVLTTIISRGWEFPSKDNPIPKETVTKEPEPVIYYTAEDGIADTLVPRLIAAGADLTKVSAVSPEMEISLTDTDMFEEMLKIKRPALMVLDTLSSIADGCDRSSSKSNYTNNLLGVLEWLLTAVDTAQHGVIDLGAYSNKRPQSVVFKTIFRRAVDLQTKVLECPFRISTTRTECLSNVIHFL